MFSVAARPLVGASKGVLSSTKRFAGAGYVMRPQKGVLNVIDTDYDHKLGPPPVRHEVRERMYEQQMREYVKDANELGADPDPHVRKERLKPKQRRRYDLNKAEGRSANRRVRSLVELINFKRERGMP